MKLNFRKMGLVVALLFAAPMARAVDSGCIPSSVTSTKGIDGPSLLHVSDANVRAQITRDFPGLDTDQNLAPLRPLTYLLRNTTGHDIVAYSVSFHVQPLHGASETVYMIAERTPRIIDMINGDLPELPADSERIVTPWFRWSRSKWAEHPDTAKFGAFSRFRFAQQAMNAKNVDVKLDAVIHDNGTLEGPDTGNLGVQFACERWGGQQEALAIATMLAGTDSEDEIQRRLQADVSAGMAVNSSSDPADLLTAGRGNMASQVLEILFKRSRPSLYMTLKKVASAPRLELTKVSRPGQNSAEANSVSSPLLSR
jgi:hypothetical protein